MTILQRPSLHEITAQDIAPIEAAFTPKWSDTWKDLARSFYITLTKQPAVPGTNPVDMAVALVYGVAKDLGGTQPYIPVGDVTGTARATQVMALLASGRTYKQVADACGITVSRVRNIERYARQAGR